MAATVPLTAPLNFPQFVEQHPEFFPLHAATHGANTVLTSQAPAATAGALQAAVTAHVADPMWKDATAQRIRTLAGGTLTTATAVEAVGMLLAWWVANYPSAGMVKPGGGPSILPP
jgi:hypothetical protein